MIKYTPKEYIQIDLANQFGISSNKFEHLIKWTKIHDTQLESLIAKAKDKYRFIAALMAYRDIQQDKPTGYLVGLDAGASGIAILGALSGCEVTARNTGIIGNSCKDIYNICTQEINKSLSTKLTLDRKVVKGALMPSYYGSKRQPEIIFGKNTLELELFKIAAQTIAPGAHYLKSILLQAWQPHALYHEAMLPDGFEIKIPVLQTMKTKLEIDELDHLSLKMQYKDNIGTEKGLSLVANFTHACDGFLVREVGRRCNYNREQLISVYQILLADLNSTHYLKTKIINYITEEEKMWIDYKFLSLVAVEYINSDTVADYSIPFKEALLKLIMTTLKNPPFTILFIFDEYLSHPNYMNIVRQKVIDVLAEMADSRMASEIISQITKTKVNIIKLNPNLGDAIRKSNYIIH